MKNQPFWKDPNYIENRAVYSAFPYLLSITETNSKFYLIAEDRDGDVWEYDLPFNTRYVATMFLDKFEKDFSNNARLWNPNHWCYIGKE